MFLIFLAGLLLAGCTQYGNATPTPSNAPSPLATTTPAPSIQTAAATNPASLHCLQLGYQEQFTNQGFCVFPDGSSCESWAFMRGRCGVSFSACAKNGGQLVPYEETSGGALYQIGVCSLPDDSVCGEAELTAGTCKPGQCTGWNAQGCRN